MIRVALLLMGCAADPVAGGPDAVLNPPETKSDGQIVDGPLLDTTVDEPFEPVDPCFPTEGDCRPEGRWTLRVSAAPYSDQGEDDIMPQDQTFEIVRGGSGGLRTDLRIFWGETTSIRLIDGCRLVARADHLETLDDEGFEWDARLLIDLRGDHGRGRADVVGDPITQSRGVRLTREGVRPLCAGAPPPYYCVPAAALAGCEMEGAWRVDRAEAPAADCTQPVLGVDLRASGAFLCAFSATRILPTAAPCGLFVQYTRSLADDEEALGPALRFSAADGLAQARVTDARCAIENPRPIRRTALLRRERWSLRVEDLPEPITDQPGDALFRLTADTILADRQAWDFEIHLDYRDDPDRTYGTERLPCTFEDQDGDDRLDVGEGWRCFDSEEANVRPTDRAGRHTVSVFRREPDGRRPVTPQPGPEIELVP